MTIGTSIEVFSNLPDKELIRFFKSWRWIEKPYSPVSIDFRKVNFIAPWAITLFAAYALYLKQQGKKLKIEMDENTVAGSYLCRSGFTELFGLDIKCIEDESTEKTAKLSIINKSDEIPSFTKHVMEILDIQDEEIEGALQYSLVELLRNVIQHSHSSIGGLAMAQYYPNTGLIEIVVADTGVGIQKTLQTNYPEIDNHFKAIKFATQPHVSGTFAKGAYNKMHENAGLGLFFIKQIVTLSGGGFFLASGDYINNIWGDSEGDLHKNVAKSKKSGWPGTFAVIQLRKDTIAEFDAVLSTCRKIADAARKNPAELSLDFLDEMPDLDGVNIINVAEFNENVEEATKIREEIIDIALNRGEIVIIDFQGIRFATQSFVHALLYKVLRDNKNAASGLSIANCTHSTKEAIQAVAGYAYVSDKDAIK